VPYWNAFVANLEMHGQGVFYDPRLDDPKQFPVAARNRFGHTNNSPDLITPKLAALHFYQLALAAPAPPAGSFDPAAAARGAKLFRAKAECATCHVPPLFTEPGWNLHTPAEIGIDRFQADRSPDPSVSHDATEGAVGAREGRLLPRRPVRHPRRRGRPLQPLLQAPPHL
jgi:hypothetical protein